MALVPPMPDIESITSALATERKSIADLLRRKASHLNTASKAHNKAREELFRAASEVEKRNEENG